MQPFLHTGLWPGGREEGRRAQDVAGAPRPTYGWL